MIDPATQWQAVCARRQAQRAAAIPEEWRIDASAYENLQNVLHVPESCGLLSAREIEITSRWDAVDLVRFIQQKKYTVVEVVVAFCKRAAIAQQLVMEHLYPHSGRYLLD